MVLEKDNTSEIRKATTTRNIHPSCNDTKLKKMKMDYQSDSMAFDRTWKCAIGPTWFD